MKIKILVDSNEFWESLKNDIQISKDSIFIQTLSFEGDPVGKKLSNLLLSSRSTDKRILVDSTSKVKLSDKFLYSPKSLLNPELRREVKETKQMIKNLGNDGIQVKFVNPVGFFLIKYPFRNHKKLIVIDENIAYIGGINFSEHNFDWHDLMVRIEEPEIAEFLKEDFLSTWKGHNLCTSKRFEGIELLILDGHSNERTFKTIMEFIERSKKQIYVESPYLTLPFYEKLREARRKGVAVTVIAPENNNWGVMQEYTPWESARSDIELRLYQNRMTHLKAMLIDDNYLVVGSANFDYLGYLLQQEIVAIITDAKVISDFKEKVIEVDLKNSRKFEGDVHRLKARISHLGIKSVKILTLLRKILY
ncbi:phosphatidylserine/phosphatidylglycerophosphate/cardiolipin synthase family protein [candidate division TA06 bacterium]|nr:phosphatidylserine/phosphatidylglycerophosphate/cardiolipin synthase family protein [candidate division TA06 bacterium]